MSMRFNFPPVKCVMFPEHESNFVKSMTALHAQEKYADLIFICKDSVHVRANKIILMSVSDFISKIVCTIGDDIVYVTLPDIEYKTVEILQSLIYEGRAKVNHRQSLYFRELISMLHIRLSNIEVKHVAYSNDYSVYENNGNEFILNDLTETRPTLGLLNVTNSSETISHGCDSNEVLQQEHSTLFDLDSLPYMIGSHTVGRSIVNILQNETSKYDTTVGISEEMDDHNLISTVKTEDTVIQPADLHNSQNGDAACDPLNSDPMTFTESSNVPHTSFTGLYNPHISSLESLVLYTPNSVISGDDSRVITPVPESSTVVKQEITDRDDITQNIAVGIQEETETDPLDSGVPYSGGQEFMTLYPTNVSDSTIDLDATAALIDSPFPIKPEVKIDGKKFVVLSDMVSRETYADEIVKEITLHEIDEPDSGMINKIVQPDISDDEGNLNNEMKYKSLKSNSLSVDDCEAFVMPVKSRKRKTISDNRQIDLITAINNPEDNAEQKVLKMKVNTDMNATNRNTKTPKKNELKAKASVKGRQKAAESKNCMEGSSSITKEQKIDEESNRIGTCGKESKIKKRLDFQQLDFLNDVNKVTRSMLKELCRDAATENTVKNIKQDKAKIQSRQSETAQSNKAFKKQAAINEDEEAIFRKYLAKIEENAIKKKSKAQKSAHEDNVPTVKKNDAKSPRKDVRGKKLVKIRETGIRKDIAQKWKSNTNRSNVKVNRMKKMQESKMSIANRKVTRVKGIRVKRDQTNQKNVLLRASKNCVIEEMKTVWNIENKETDLALDMINKQYQQSTANDNNISSMETNEKSTTIVSKVSENDTETSLVTSEASEYSGLRHVAKNIQTVSYSENQNFDEYSSGNKRRKLDKDDENYSEYQDLEDKIVSHPSDRTSSQIPSDRTSSQSELENTHEVNPDSDTLSLPDLNLLNTNNTTDTSAMDTVKEAAVNFVEDSIHEKVTDELKSTIPSELLSDVLFETEKNDEWVYKCLHCAQNFDCRGSFDNHVMVVHFDKFGNTQEHNSNFQAPRQYKSKSKPDHVEKKCVCGICYESFTDVQVFISHLKTHAVHNVL